MAAHYENQVEDTRHIFAVQQALLFVLRELYSYSIPPGDILLLIRQKIPKEDCLELDAADPIGVTKKAVELFEELN